MTVSVNIKAFAGDPPGAERRPPPLALIAAATAIGFCALHMVVPTLPLLARVFDRGAAEVQLVLTLYFLGIAAGQLIYGPVSDRFGRRTVYGWTALLCGILAFPAFWVMHYSGSVILAGAAIVFAFGFVYAPVYGPEAALFCELFDTRVRYTGISFVYQFSGIFASGITPLIATALIKSGDGQPWQLCMYVLFSGIVSALSAWMIGRSKPAGDLPAFVTPQVR